MDVQKKLDEIVDAVGSARSMPMSASCVVNRADLLAMLQEVRDALPTSLAQAEEVIDGHQQLTAQARQEADRIIQEAHVRRSTLIADTVIARQSQEEADRILADARREAEEIRAEADEYVDSKLANFEVVLTKTIGSVDRGREKLLGRAPDAGEDGAGFDPDDDAPEYSSDPHTLINRADEYVDAKLGAFEAVLSKTLEAVGRGREKLHGRIASDDLGLLADQDGDERRGHTSDADFLADLAEPGRKAAPSAPDAAPSAAEPVVHIPSQSGPYQEDPGAAGAPAAAAYADPGYGAGYDTAGGAGYQDQGYAEQDPAYAAQAAAYQGYQQDAYGYQQDPYAYPQQGADYSQQGAQDYTQQGQTYGWHQDDGQQQAQQQGAALDETSFFDTSMIDLEELRRYEQGH